MSTDSPEPSNKELKKLLNQILTSVSNNEKKYEEVNNQVNINTADITENKEELQQLKREVEKLKNSAKAKNIIIYGIEDTNNINDNLANNIKDILESINLSLENADYYYRLGKPTSDYCTKFD